MIIFYHSKANNVTSLILFCIVTLKFQIKTKIYLSSIRNKNSSFMEHWFYTKDLFVQYLEI